MDTFGLWRGVLEKPVSLGDGQPHPDGAAEAGPLTTSIEKVVLPRRRRVARHHIHTPTALTKRSLSQNQTPTPHQTGLGWLTVWSTGPTQKQRFFFWRVGEKHPIQECVAQTIASNLKRPELWPTHGVVSCLGRIVCGERT